jgi:hypothetical protein
MGRGPRCFSNSRRRQHPPVGHTLAMVNDYTATQGFERDILACLSSLVASMPNGVADLYIGRHPDSEKSFFPYFRVTPKNSKSAVISGTVCEGQGIDLRIGRATTVEIFAGHKPESIRKATEKFVEICRAIFYRTFEENVVNNSRGRVIWSSVVLRLDNGKQKWLGGGRLFWWLNFQKITSSISYEPYC